jgi:CRP-like cAMP-binding protein
MTWRQRILGIRPDGKLDKLKQVPELAALRDEELGRVAAAGELAVIPAGTVLVNEGEPARWCYLVLSGSVASTRPRRAGGPVSGPGTTVGDAELLARTSSTATVAAVGDLVVLAMSSREFTGLLDTCPGFSHAVHVSLSKRITEGLHPSPHPRPRPVLQLVRGA